MNELIHVLQTLAYLDRYTWFLVGLAIGLWLGLTLGSKS
jgi:hypothetical protein